MSVKERARSIARRLEPGLHDRRQFLEELPESAIVLDVGCGNDCPYTTKTLRPDLHYVGLDVGDYRNAHEPTEYADEYVVVSPDEFVSAIAERAGECDAVISSHNLEHCSDPDGVTVAMARALRPGGRIYLAFPSEATLRMPSRGGCLNFFDDTSHVRPPDFQRVLELLRQEGVLVDFCARRHRPPTRAILGFVSEPLSRHRNTVMRGTWALYGFESVIWGTVMSQDIRNSSEPSLGVQSFFRGRPQGTPRGW